MSASHLVGASVLELASRVRARDVSAVEVVAEHLDRIERFNDELGAFVSVRREAALADAQLVDARRDLVDLPLAGVPVAIKDNLDVAGEPTRHGSAATLSIPAAADDPMVGRLRRAGAVVVGKSNMPELAIWHYTAPSAFGRARNPWNLDRIAGGSTGGGAAAVAAAMVPLSLGSDGGGSIRIPSACCGVFGLKPGPGVVEPAVHLREHWFGMSAFGPIAFHADDAAVALDVLSESHRFTGVPPPGRLRIAFSLKPPYALAGPDADTRDATLETARLLEELGHQVSEADPPYSPVANMHWLVRWLPGIARDAEQLDAARLEPGTRSMARAGRLLMKARLVAHAADDGSGQRLARWLEQFDVLVTPVCSTPATTFEQWESHWFVNALRGSDWVWTLPWSVARVPVGAIPARVSVDGLPVGLQVVAARGGEATILAVARQLEQVRPWRRPPQFTTRMPEPSTTVPMQTGG